MITTSNYSYKLNDLTKNKKYKLACFDLDHTLIKPKQGRVHPNSPEDFMLWNPIVLERLTELEEQNYILVIFTNQNIKKKEILEGRINTLKVHGIFDKVNFLAALEQDYCRKPNTGLFDLLLEKTHIKVDFQKSIMVGDAAGRVKVGSIKKDFSCADRMFAANIGLTFQTPEEFFLHEKERKFIMERVSDRLFPGYDNNYPSEYLQYQVIMLMAPPASGKSTLAKQLEKEGYYRINQDTLGTKGKCVKAMKEQLGKDLTKKIVLDNTNSKIDYRVSFTKYLTDLGIKYCLVQIDTTKEQCFFLDNYRCKLEKKKKLPDVALHSHFKFRELPTLKEGFDKIFKIPFIPEFNSTKELAIFNQYYC